MATNNPLTVRLPVALKRELDELAKVSGQTRSVVVQEALAKYLPHKILKPTQGRIK